MDPTDHFAYQGILTEQGTLRKYESFEELVKHIEERRDALRYPKIPNLRLQIQHYLYMLGEANQSHFIPINQAPYGAEIPRTATNDIIAGATIAYELSREAFSGIFKRGGNSSWATTDEAERRAGICANCPKNVDLKKPALQRLNNRIASLFSMRRTTTRDDELFDCQVCGCPNQIKVHYAANLIRKATPDKFKAEDFPENFIGTKDRERHDCWVRQILDKEK